MNRLQGARNDMHKKISRELNLQKTAVLTVLSNSLQILAALGALLLSLLTHGQAFTGRLETCLMAAISLVVCWGAIMDIREATKARQVGQEADSLEAALTMLEQQQATLRAQRHDFMNHLQVVYSLLELQEYDAAGDYLEKVYGDIKRVNRTLKTAHPAINALLAAKMGDCEARGIALELNIESPWQNMPVPSWEICRVLGNLIDNAMDALAQTPRPSIRVGLGEDLHAFSLCVANNGPMIPEALRESIFQTGFSTKSAGRGMGLSIVREIVERHGGEITLSSDDQETRFCVVMTKNPQNAGNSVCMP